MSTVEAACYSTPEESGLRVETLPFEKIPHQSRLFLDYLKDPVALRRFYPSAVRFHHELPQRVPEVLAAYQVDRNKVCDALAAMNDRWGAGDATLENIRLLRESDCIAVVSGQQAGLFTGPLYTIYKAISAVKLAGCLRQRNTKAVPVFWIAAEDHDFAEVAKAEIIGRDCQLKHVDVSTDLHREGQPVGLVTLDHSINLVVDQLFELLPNSEFAADMKALVKNAWQPGRGYVESFATMMTVVAWSLWFDISRSSRSGVEATRCATLFRSCTSRAGNRNSSRAAKQGVGECRISRAGAGDREFVSALSSRRRRQATRGGARREW